MTGDQLFEDNSEDLPVAEPGKEAIASDSSTPTDKKKRKARPFPAMSFSEALSLASAIQEHGAGQQVRRTTLFSKLGRSPDSGPTRRLVTASGQYGLTTGGYSAEFLDLTSEGRLASDPGAPDDTRLRASYDLAIAKIAPFAGLQARYQSSRLASAEMLRDTAVELGVDETQAAECVETFLANARDLHLIHNIGGSERILSVEEAMDLRPTPPAADVKIVGASASGPSRASSASGEAETQSAAASPPPTTPPINPTRVAPGTSQVSDLSDVCFVISPIGEEVSDERSHADLVRASIIEPAMATLGLRVVRADKISKPGLITGQVIDHLSRATLVIADLSFSNANVYYELALRHATRKATVQITRASDRLPFDVGQFRTVVMDMSSIYTLVPALDLHRQEITRQARAALADANEHAESPLSRFYPDFWTHIL